MKRLVELFRNPSLGTKIAAVILFASTVSLVGAAVTIIGYEASTAKGRISDELRGLAQLLAVNTEAALEFSDPEAASENLRSLRTRPDIVSAAVYTRDGQLFATYEPTPGSSAPPRTLPSEDEGSLQRQVELLQPVGSVSAPAGFVYLRADLAPMEAFIQRYALVVAGMFAVLWLASAGLAIVLQRAIARPILGLVDVARRVTEHQDYSLRTERHGNDEIGLLSGALNQMLTRIEQQHVELSGAYAELEQQHRSLLRETGERQKVEEALRVLNAELESRVAARTAQLADSNRELESFSYSISHDLRAPLRGIDGFSRILLEEYAPALDEEAHRLIGIIRQSCANMGQLIDDLLAFSRLGRTPLTTVNADMGQIVNGVIDELRAIPGENLPEITLEALPAVECDPALLRQVWANLISNAAKFSSGKEQPRIRIWSERAAAGHIFAIADNGAGFDMAYAKKLFSVFQRLHGNDEFPGTGVGLATVKRVIVRHGGEVWAEGKPQEGATFYFSLPEEIDNERP